MTNPGWRRRVARTVLLVGEGGAEEQFLRHVKALYVRRGSGVVVTIKNARGKGAIHVIDVAIRLSRNAEYDVRAALLDTDTDWNDKARATARKGRINVLPADPCLEALLLQIHRHPTAGRSTAQLKQDFAAHFGTGASATDVYHRHFTIDVLHEARSRLPLLEQLLTLMEMARI